MSRLVVGVPTEIKVDEFRVAVTPDGVRELRRHGETAEQRKHRLAVDAAKREVA